MAAAAAAAQGVGGLISAKAALDEGQSSAAVHEFNYRTDIANAGQAIANATEDERRARIVSSKMIGQNRAAIGASGAQLGGSSLDVLASNVTNAELDALSIRHKGAMAAYNYRQQGKLEKFQGDTAVQNSYLASAGAIIGAGGAAGSTLAKK